jgi:perosamine synthetase
MKKEVDCNLTVADPYFSEQDRLYIHKELDKILSGKLSMGPNVKQFEKEMEKAIGVQHAIAMNSCSSALESCLMAYNLKKDDEVIVPSQTFIATGMSVYLAGGIPVFAEISPKTLCLDIDDVKNRITTKTKGIIIVYFLGHVPENIFEFREFCDSNNLFLIEDVAHAPGAKLSGKVAGSIGHAGCFSFYSTKTITAGEGGMITTNDNKLASILRSIQNRGQDLFSSTEVYSRPGRNVRMTEFNALIGRTQLKHLDDILIHRRRVVRIFKQILLNHEGYTLVLPNDEEASSYWKFPILLDSKNKREEITKFLHDKKIMCDWTYPVPLHCQPVFKKILGTEKGILPQTEDITDRIICLPCHQRISNEEAEFIANSFVLAVNKFGGNSNDC